MLAMLPAIGPPSAGKRVLTLGFDIFPARNPFEPSEERSGQKTNFVGGRRLVPDPGEDTQFIISAVAAQEVLPRARKIFGNFQKKYCFFTFSF